ncbi:Nucleotide-binding universal stress protein, UspA family [Nonomuraea maritima]|uniref:Nucleotide-binding universal stress protein, UspA family n=1 Tax=Nonomuraea maritima TaxID=683260 RepID=A0A1G9IZZ7_9ACTN|nr:universal stress protein [Nonomuraea maritima]SDL30616.1 Nucleotide-binding universal stress protein, UspA family [Nonomuraea maritima]
MSRTGEDPRWEPGPALSGHFEIGKDGARLLVVGYDGSEPSRNALAYAAGLARRDDAALLVAFVEALITPTLWFLAGSPIIPDSAVDLRDDLRTELVGWPVPWAFVNVRGDTARQLEALAEAYKADAIIVGRSRSSWHSVAARLAKRARRTVLVVP